jgi:hypothetical protein
MLPRRPDLVGLAESTNRCSDTEETLTKPGHVRAAAYHQCIKGTNDGGYGQISISAGLEEGMMHIYPVVSYSRESFLESRTFSLSTYLALDP